MAKVLIVEDDRLSQKVMGQVLTNAGHEALFADSTRKAWEKLQEHVLVDLVVLDNQLNQEWGWQFLRRMRHWRNREQQRKCLPWIS
jgi:CheY-like chemotaxis protein